MIKRQDGSVSRTKGLNIVGDMATAAIAGMAYLQPQISPVYYAVAMFVFVSVNKYIRATQTRL